MKFMLGAAAILGGLLLWTGPVAAHHALQAQFDTNKVLSLKGELARVEWINPHAYFWFDVKDETGKVEEDFSTSIPSVYEEKGKAVRTENPTGQK